MSWTRFQMFTCTVLCLFLFLLGTVVVIAYSRPSGSSGLAMLEKMREKSSKAF